MTDSKDTVPASGDGFDVTGQFEGSMADDTFSWMLYLHEMDVDGTASADENLCFVEGMSMGITATNGAADTMNDSSTSKDSLVDARMSQESPSTLPLETTSACCIHCSTARGNIRTPIVINDPDDERATEIPNYIRVIVGSDILEEEMGSEYGGETVDDLQQQRGFNRASRRQGAMNQLRDTHVGFTIKVLERLIVQVQARDDGEGNDKRFRNKGDCLLSELKATDATLGVMDWLASSDIQRYRVKLHRARWQRKNSETV
ncbi:hypothetical protein ACEPPN_000408 [Leptodophora sp. 'Broadleaf-Isolate-01']